MTLLGENIPLVPHRNMRGLTVPGTCISWAIARGETATVRRFPARPLYAGQGICDRRINRLCEPPRVSDQCAGNPSRLSIGSCVSGTNRPALRRAEAVLWGWYLQ